ncbi:MAG TPA: citrate synthase [Pseudoclavibacter sp.]|nr:citrate synthase [Pseudoclavibacter sp.]
MPEHTGAPILDTTPIPVIPENVPKAVLDLPDNEVEFPLVDATEGPGAIAISSLNKQTGRNILDPGFMNTAATKSAITYIDGVKGVLRYRGYPIDQLAASSTFLEVAWLLIYGELPTEAELEKFDTRIRSKYLVHEGVLRYIESLPLSIHPMTALSASLAVLSAYNEDVLDPLDANQVDEVTIRLIAQLPTIIAAVYKHSVGQAFIYPNRDLGYIENFLTMMFADMAGEYLLEPVLSKSLERLLILHEDHEQNASTSTVRNVGSTHADLIMSIIAGVAALSGPRHGGANEAVLEMLESIRDSGTGVQDFVDRVKNREEGVRLMGFGHRVYKNYDPRARLVKESAHDVLEALGVQDDLLDIAGELEAIALADDYFIQRRLYPNVDFYTGVIYKAMGFPTNMFTVLFALGRLPGWIAHWRELVEEPDMKILRPQQVYVGAPERDYPAKFVGIRPARRSRR